MDTGTATIAIALWFFDIVGMLIVSALLMGGFYLVWASTRRSARAGVWSPADEAFVDRNEHLIRAFQAIAFIPLFLLLLAHLYGASSFVTGYSYLVDFVRPALTILGMLSVGFLFGGLFGLPNRATPAVNGGTASGVQFGDRLEQIADWLTKLLIGAGLTQLSAIAEHYEAIDTFFSGATGMQVHRPLGVVVAFAALASGFLLGYVSALLFMPVALSAGVQQLAASGSPAPGAKRDTVLPAETLDPGDEEDHPAAPEGDDDPGDEEDHPATEEAQPLPIAQ